MQFIYSFLHEKKLYTTVGLMALPLFSIVHTFIIVCFIIITSAGTLRIGLIMLIQHELKKRYLSCELKKKHHNLKTWAICIDIYHYIVFTSWHFRE
ncbi:hypothetical protein ACJX0J_030180, partial [Zea mays]